MAPNYNLVLISVPTLTSYLKFDDPKNCESEKKHYMFIVLGLETYQIICIPEPRLKLHITFLDSAPTIP